MQNIEKISPQLYIENQYINNTKLARILATGHPKSNEYFEIKFSENNSLEVKLQSQINETITQHDMIICDCIYTLYHNGYSIITADWVGRVASGDMKKRVSKAQLERINSAINKLSQTHIHIHLTDSNAPKTDYKSMMLCVINCEVEYTDHTRTNGYKICGMSAIFQYATSINQIIKVPNAYFQTQKLLSDTVEVVILKRYLLKKIYQIKHKKNKLNSNKIALSWYDNKTQTERGLFAELGYCQYEFKDWSSKKKQLLKIISTILNILKEQKLIKDYTSYREHNSQNPSIPIMGFLITT